MTEQREKALAEAARQIAVRRVTDELIERNRDAIVAASQARFEAVFEELFEKELAHEAAQGAPKDETP